MSLLAILEAGPSFGLQLRNEFEVRTGDVWPLNVGQVYTTLDRLERDELVELQPDAGPEGQKVYRITAAGRKQLGLWFMRASSAKAPSRDELVLKLVMAASREPSVTADIVQAERRAAIEQLQDYTRLKRDTPDGADLGWLFLLDSLIFQTEARVRWLDACEARLAQGAPARKRSARANERAAEQNEVKA